MFNDERINAECGKIYSRGILFAVLITLLYALSRTVTLIMQGSLHSVFTYTEAAILFLGIGILSVGSFKFHKDRDERTISERHSFYKKAGKAFIIAVLGVYILTIPFTTKEMLGGQYHNHLLILIEVIGYLYLFYSFKTKEINFNYSFIAENASRYYRRVFWNIGILLLGLFPPFLLAAMWELVLNDSFSGALTILFAYISSAIGLSIEYFFISLVEKTSYDSVNDGRFALGTRIAMIVCLVFEFTMSVMQCAYVYLVTANQQAIPNIGKIISFVLQQKKSLQSLLIVLSGLVVCHILSQIKKGTLLYTVCGVKMLLLALSAIEATITPVLYRALSAEAFRFLINTIKPWSDFISFAITLTLCILFVHSLIKELGISRILWTVPALYGAVTLLNIYFTSQHMIRTGAYCKYIVEMACLLLLVILLWRYRGFVANDADGTAEQ